MLVVPTWAYDYGQETNSVIRRGSEKRRQLVFCDEIRSQEVLANEEYGDRGRVQNLVDLVSPIRPWSALGVFPVKRAKSFFLAKGIEMQCSQPNTRLA